MRFYDKVKVRVIGWYWGNGCVSWRREKYIAYGGPDGWDGWKGWSVYFVGDEGESSLLNLHYQKQIKAKKGEHWKGSQQYGENAPDVFVKVPVWTVIKDAKTWEILWMIKKHWEKVLVAKGWRWGWWNMHFATPTRQFPSFAMAGEPGEQRDVEAELQLIWDVTLIGFPSVGKSSIINTLANTKAKVADYHFTTLVPNLGVVKHKWKNFVLVDVPGLIEWAGSGKGLGNEFLRHILKSKVWTFVLDVSRFEDSFKELEILKKEIEFYVTEEVRREFGRGLKSDNLKFEYEVEDWVVKMKVYAGESLLFEKYILFLVNKVDLVQDEEILQEYKKQLEEEISRLFGVKNVKIFFVNAGNQKAFEDFLNEIVKLLDKKLNQDALLDEYLMPKEDFATKEETTNYVKNITDEEINKLIQEWYLEPDEAENVQVWEVYNPKLAYYTWILPWWNKEAEMFFYEVMNSEWISSWLENNWVFPGDIIKVKSPYPGQEDRYLMWGNNT